MSESADEMVRCGFCGTLNRKGRVNCYKCGAWGLAGPLPSHIPYRPEAQRSLQVGSSQSSVHSNLESKDALLSIESTRLHPVPAVANEHIVWSPPSSSVASSDFEDPWFESQISNTSRGLLLLAIGLVLTIIPLIGIIGLILAVIGAVYVIIGREAFGGRHSMYVVIGAVLYSICTIAVIIVGLSFIGDFRSAFLSSTSPSVISDAVGNVIRSYLLTLFVLGIISDLATIVFTYAIQDRTGKLLLWLSFGVSILLAIPALLLLSQLPSATYEATSTNNPTPLYDFVGQAQALSYLGIIPAIITAIAYLNARSRMNSGQIPHANVLSSSLG